MIDYKIITLVMLFIILISIQFTLNKIYMELKNIKSILIQKKGNEVAKYLDGDNRI